MGELTASDFTHTAPGSPLDDEQLAQLLEFAARLAFHAVQRGEFRVGDTRAALTEAIEEMRKKEHDVAVRWYMDCQSAMMDFTNALANIKLARE